MKNSQLSDNEFLAGFESGTFTDFHHVDHIRVAWIYPRWLPFSEASQRMAESLRHFAATKGAHMKYHQTITQVWMLLVAHALEQDPQAAHGQRTLSGETTPGAPSDASRADHSAAPFDSFAAAHPELLDVQALDRFYSSQLLASTATRSKFVPPDYAPLPGPAHNLHL